MKLNILFLITVLLGLGGCKTKQVTTSIQKSVDGSTNEKSTVQKYCVDNEHDIIWTDINPSKLPKGLSQNAYHLYRVDGLVLRQLFEKSVKDRVSEFNLGIPVYKNGVTDCMSFVMTNSGAISQEKQKSIGHFSCRGYEPKTENYTVRADMTVSNGLKAYITGTNGENYILQEVQFLGGDVYISYNRKDFAEISRQLEEKQIILK